MAAATDKVNQIVLQYLETQGFKDAATSLEKQLNTQGVRMDRKKD